MFCCSGYCQGMSSPLAIAASGMMAATLRLNVSASNVANSLSSGPLPDATGPGATAPAAYTPLRVDQVDVGGATSATATPVLPSYAPTYAPSAAYADKSGMVAAPDVDLANEAVQQMTAKCAFTANAKVMRVASQMMGALLDITA
jgi:flagellar basal-body rod protein FlgC